jgi:NAD(P)-dependent dehydrogenase (short-subunit alcohol dehydrogenase family)
MPLYCRASRLIYDRRAKMDLTKKGALVTGASRGLGAALARALAKRGARVVLVARGREELMQVAAEIRAAGGEAHALVEDVGDKRAAHRIAGAAQALVGPLELVVHNASSLGPVPLAPLADTDCEELERVLAVNLVGPFRLTKALVGAMMLHGRGVVVHVSSDAAVAAYPRWGAYGVSKAALDHLSRIWAAELDGTGVRFVSIDPGEMDTAMHAAALPEADKAQLADPARVAERIVALLERGEVASGARLEAQAGASP